MRADELVNPADGRGPVVVVAGPDGTGKSSVVDALLPHLPTPILRLHHRPSALPHRTRSDGVVSEPHAAPTYSRLVSIGKLLYVWADFAIGWVLRVRPTVRAGGTVVLERGWWDLLVDQRRYRLDAPPALLRVLGGLLPRPDVTLVLGGDAAAIHERKPELGLPELDRQLGVWRHVAAGDDRAVILDATIPLAQVVEAARAAVSAAVRR